MTRDSRLVVSACFSVCFQRLIASSRSVSYRLPPGIRTRYRCLFSFFYHCLVYWTLWSDQVERQGRQKKIRAPFHTDPEPEVVKIFGVYTHAQFDNRLWDSVGYQLGRRGKEYRRRCTFRSRPHNKGDNVFMPACFPPPDTVEEELSNVPVPELPCDNLEEVRSPIFL